MNSTALTGKSDDLPPQKRVWVICEGKHEQGGALKILIERILPEATQWKFEYEDWKNPRGIQRRFRSTPKGDGVFKKFVAAIFDAKQLDFDCVIGLVDCDRDSSRIRSVDRAQEIETIDFPRAFGVAIETYDAWFLADEKALSTTLNLSINAQPDPEANRDAKSAMSAFCNDSALDLGLAECYWRIAKSADLELIARRCPRGFEVWRARVAELMKHNAEWK